MRNSKLFGYCLGIALLCGLMSFILHAGETGLQGAWKIERYELKDGSAPRVRGTIVFGDHDWVVLFFVVDADGKPLRGSGEGGSYSLEGDRLLFTHMFLMFSGGDPVDGLPQSQPEMKLDSRHEEECRVDLKGERLTIFFPSGNRLWFSRSS